MNKQAQIADTEILTSPGFLILCGLAIGATLIGYVMGRKWDMPSFPVWQLILILVGEVVASYVFIARG